MFTFGSSKPREFQTPVVEFEFGLKLESGEVITGMI